jgi:hypothetical protein
VIEALSQRGRRFGTGPIALWELERREGKVLVKLSGEPPRPERWEVVGRLDHRDGGPGRIGFATRDLDRAAWSGAGPWCEHCGLLRRRTVTFLVRRGDGEIRQIGSSCLRDYTGHDLPRVARQAELMRKGRAEVRRSARNSAPSAGLDLIDEEWREAVFLGPVGAWVEARSRPCGRWGAIASGMWSGTGCEMSGTAGFRGSRPVADAFDEAAATGCAGGCAVIVSGEGGR